ncbi:MAG: hypothetical protein ACM3TR_11070 [Caulobacteraceae bacterium]
MSLYWFQDGIYVIDTIDKYKSAMFKRIAEINGVDVNKFIEGLSGIIPRDNSAQLKFIVPYYLVLPEFLYGLGLAPDIGRARFTFADSLGGRFNIKMDAASTKQSLQFITEYAGMASKPLYRRNAEEY